MESVLMRLALLAMTLFLVGCLPTTTIHTAATEVAIASDVCRVWKPVIYSRHDTPGTVDGPDGIRANNAARDAYCGKGVPP